jgi:enamine deaminase RidA (YjgF/YER057c/UK114 family)
MNIIFEYETKKLILPVNPDKVKITKPSPSQRVEVVGIGEVSVPQTRKLASISISSFFWEDMFNQSFLLSGLGSISGFLPSSIKNSIENQAQKGLNKVKDAIGGALSKSQVVQGAFNSMVDDSQKFKVLNEYVKWFEDWQASGKPARWTIVVPPNEPPQCFDFNVTCENFTYEVRAGEEGDYYYELELLEWRNYGAKVLNPKEQSDGSVKFETQPKARLDVKAEIKQEITATKKDSIWSMSKRYCKENWQDIYNETANKVAMSASPQDISGQILKIPKQYISRIS